MNAEASLTRRTRCNLCPAASQFDAAAERIEINSNVRKFAHERFTVWRCASCRSLHSLEVVDLPRYYKDYPFQRQKADIALRIISRSLFRRLRSAGYRREHSLLDFGCGSGLFVEWLRRKGFSNTHRFDAYTEKFNDASALQRKYDFVVAQDVIEHVEDAGALLDQLIDLTEPGGVLSIGTPNADALDLQNPALCVHSLHQPYHLHVLSEQVLRKLAEVRGLTVERFYDVFYADTFVPFANVRFCHHYSRLYDNTIDLAFDPYRFSWRLLTPKSLALAFFGRFLPVRTEMMFLFRKPG